MNLIKLIEYVESEFAHIPTVRVTIDGGIKIKLTNAYRTPFVSVEGHKYNVNKFNDILRSGKLEFREDDYSPEPYSIHLGFLEVYSETLELLRDLDNSVSFRVPIGEELDVEVFNSSDSVIYKLKVGLCTEDDFYDMKNRVRWLRSAIDLLEGP